MALLVSVSLVEKCRDKGTNLGWGNPTGPQHVPTKGKWWIWKNWPCAMGQSTTSPPSFCSSGLCQMPTSKSPVGDISVVTLIRTDTTLDHSQKAEKVCMYVCIYVCMYGWMDVRTYVRMYVCMDVCMDVCMHACMYICTYMCMCIACMHACMYICTCMCMHICICICICMYIYVYICIYI